MRALTFLDKGRKFSAKINNCPVSGKIQVEDGKYFLCQNNHCGDPASNKLGYSFSWTVLSGSLEDIKTCQVTELLLPPVTAEEIEAYKNFREDDVLVNRCSSAEQKIVKKFGDLVLNIVTGIHGETEGVVYTCEELYRKGWRLKIEPTEEESVEMSIGEIAVKLGIDVKLLKIVE